MATMRSEIDLRLTAQEEGAATKIQARQCSTTAQKETSSLRAERANAAASLVQTVLRSKAAQENMDIMGSERN